MVPPSSLEWVPLSDIIKIRSGALSDLFQALLSEQNAVLASARILLAPTRRRQLASDVFTEEPEAEE